MGRSQQEQVAVWFRDVFASDWTKLALSALIILSVLPFDWVYTYGLVFFAIFIVELFCRFAVLRSDFRRREINRVEIVFFAIDVVAVLSFLPIELLWDDTRFLRLLRLSRMLLLLGYWGPIVREIWLLLRKRERRYQLFFAGVSVLILSFLSAVLLFHFHSSSIDFNEDGNLANDRFWDMLWWSFRQIQDPGNLVKDANASFGFFCSLLLTVAGLFVFSFIIGIATSVVEELVKVGRERRLGVKYHSVICNIDPFSRVLLEELVAYYAKSLRSPRIVTMGPAPTRYSYMYEGPLAAIRYRQGQPLSLHDLQKVDTDRATRVILLGQRDRDESDSEVISQILSAREMNPDCDIFAELFRGDNVQAALRAGGPRTVPILADRLVGLFLAKIVTFPGVEQIYGDLLTSKGDEIYTCLFGEGAMQGRRPPSGQLSRFGQLLERGHRAHGVILLGSLVADETERHGYAHRLNPGGDWNVAPDRLRGLFGVASSFERLKELVVSLPDVAPSRGEPERQPPPAPRFGLCPRACQLSSILICGFHDGLVEFCEQLILLSGIPRIFVMLPSSDQIPRVMEAFLDRPEVHLLGPQVQGVDFERGEGEGLRFEIGESSTGGTVQLMVGDWSHERSMLERPEVRFRLSEMDAMLFTYSPGDPDPDARTALGLLKMITIMESRPAEIKVGLRVVCEVQSTEKANLLQNRFCQPREVGPRCQSVSIVAAESMRNALLAQGMFVPGIDLIYRELLSEVGQEISKMVVTDAVDPAQRLTFGDLLSALHSRDGVMLIGVELEQHGQRRVVVNPHPRSDDYHFPAGDLAGVFVIGEYSKLPKATRNCPGCPGRSPPPVDTPD